MARTIPEMGSSKGAGEGAGAPAAGERRREKRRQERKRKIFWTKRKKFVKISVLYNSYLRLHGDPCWSTAVA